MRWAFSECNILQNDCLCFVAEAFDLLHTPIAAGSFQIVKRCDTQLIDEEFYFFGPSPGTRMSSNTAGGIAACSSSRRGNVPVF